MGRPRRNFVPGKPVHVTQRGNNRQIVFRCEADCRYLWRCLREASDLHSVDVNAYVFMPNHIHLLLTPGELGGIARFMHAATRRYAGYFNKRYERTGTLWEGRYRPSRVITDRYFLNCHRYIDSNPVRSMMAAHPGDYAWSSYRFYALGESNSLVRAHDAMLSVDDDPAKRQSFYRALFAKPLEDDDLKVIRACTQAGRDMGDPPRRGRPRKINLAPFF